jgi:hypothetical protein
VAEARRPFIVVKTFVVTVPLRRVMTARTPHCRIAEVVAVHGSEFGVPETTAVIPSAKSTVSSAWSRQRKTAGDNQQCGCNPDTPGRAK